MHTVWSLEHAQQIYLSERGLKHWQLLSAKNDTRQHLSLTSAKHSAYKDARQRPNSRPHLALGKASSTTVCSWRPLTMSSATWRYSAKALCLPSVICWHSTKTLPSTRHKVLNKESIADKLITKSYLSSALPNVIDALPGACDTRQRTLF